MEKLRVRPSIWSKESVASYLYRLALVNHYSTVFYFATMLSTTVPKMNNNTFNEKQLSMISYISDTCRTDLFHSTYSELDNYLGPKLLSKILLKNKVKFCPHCIKDALYHHHAWGLLPLNICFDHHIELVDCCQCCGKTIPLNSFMNGFCSQCGFSFASTNGVIVDRSDYLFVSQLDLSQAFHYNNKSILPLGLSLKDFFLLSFHTFHLLDGMRSYIANKNEKVKIFHNKSNGYRDSSAMMIALGNVYWMLQDFPNHFFRLLSDFHGHKYKKKQNLYGKKEQFERIFGLINHPTLKEAYEQFWLDKLDKGIVRKDFSIFKKAPTLLEQRKFISKDEIRTDVGMSYEMVEQLSENSKLLMVTSQKGKLSRYMIEKDSLTSVLDQKNMFISKKEAALVLGIQRDSVPKLINAGLLKKYKLTPKGVEKLNLAELQDLVIRCRGELVKEINGISFHEALIKYSVNGLKIIDLIQFTLDGQLKPINANACGSLADNYFNIHEIEKCLQIIKNNKINEQGYFMSDVMRILRVGEKTLKHMAEQKVLEPVKVIRSRNGRNRYFYNKSEVLALAMMRKNA
ncbi:TniQ family protein [Paenibacillus sp. 32352]|uniref:TniQ family protein n=1 Tax=Paenibacillus sp. 32352 TaxID=1969111 RepID=UPI0009ABD624|nr:TniQ family protein [Paenibacillus sp. 32352]